jgi:hypothetical protein
MKFIFHTTISISLYLVGEYITLISLQILFFTIFLKWKYSIYLFYLPLLLLSLTELFASSIYILYFLNLTIFFIFLYKNSALKSIKEFIIYALYLFGLFSLLIYYEDFFYEISLDINITDKINSISIEVIYILNMLHLIILYLIGIIKKNY